MSEAGAEEALAGLDAGFAAAARPVKRSITIAGHRTSIVLEACFWEALDRAAAAEGLSLPKLVERIDEARAGGLASALRVWLFRRTNGA